MNRFTALLLASILSAQIDLAPSEAIAVITFSDRSVPRLRYAIELRDELRKRGRLCDHTEDWDATIRADACCAEGSKRSAPSVANRRDTVGETLEIAFPREGRAEDVPLAPVCPR